MFCSGSYCYFQGTVVIRDEGKASASSSATVKRNTSGEIRDALVVYNPAIQKIQLEFAQKLLREIVDYRPEKHSFTTLTPRGSIELSWVAVKSSQESLPKLMAIINFLKDATELTDLKLAFGSMATSARHYTFDPEVLGPDRGSSVRESFRKLLVDLIPQIINNNPGLSVLNLTEYNPKIDFLSLRVAIKQHLCITSLGTTYEEFERHTLLRNKARNVTLTSLLLERMKQEEAKFKAAQWKVRTSLSQLQKAEPTMREIAQEIQDYAEFSASFVDPEEKEAELDRMKQELLRLQTSFHALLGSTIDSLSPEASAKRLAPSSSSALPDDPDTNDDSAKRQRRL